MILKYKLCLHCVCFLPLAFSKQRPWSLTSMVPAHCSPVICAQLESRRPQTGVHSSDTADAESHNPAGRTSVRAGWCRCLVPSSADGPVDPPWTSSSPFKCIQTTWMVVCLFASCAGHFVSWSLSQPPLLMPWVRVRQGGASDGQVRQKRADSNNPKQICNEMAVATAQIQTGTRLKGTSSTVLIASF